jgi:hypothetical protein
MYINKCIFIYVYSYTHIYIFKVPTKITVPDVKKIAPVPIVKKSDPIIAKAAVEEVRI